MSIPATDTGMATSGRHRSAARALNVAFFTPSARGGHPRYSQALLGALAELGETGAVRPSLVTSVDLAPEHRVSAYPIHAVLPRLIHRSEFRDVLQWVGARLAHYPSRERHFLQWVERQPDLDLIHFQEHTPWLAPRLFRTLRRRGIAVVETVHNIFLHRYWTAAHRLAHDRLERAAWRECDALIVHTEGLRRELSSFLGPRHPPIHVTPHAVWRVPGAPRRAEEPSETNLLGPLLFFGVIRPNKGLLVLLKAMEHLPERTLVVAGMFDSPDHREKVRREIDLRLPGRVELHDGFVSDEEAAEFFDRCSVVVLPYTAFASQSGVLHQALAHGRPVVVSEVGALGESVREWGAGEVVPPGDDRALAEAIARLLRPEAYCAAAEAVARVRGGLTWASMAEATLDVYRSVLA
jgi:glycosyltransferase involved in cell wall biosynthesis